ncbi:MAG TPA: ubiquinol oxidase subunit II [Candidatus Babeliales bacterium]|nr:ubiquinol oxidase subunit II [Candidatus Babeliales bacterium]
MSTKKKIAASSVIAVAILVLAINFLRTKTIAVFEPHGSIGSQEKDLIITASLLALVVIIPVYVMLIGFAWRYRDGNKKSHYDPDFSSSRLLEGIWWGIPLVLITVLAVITWRSSHNLDPFKPLNSKVPAINIQVVSMQWKWLFIYPKEGIASVNFVELPVNTPVRFDITSDAPMNSFWIPQLGGQMYAMTGMSSQLNLEANHTGSYRGVSANISGEGFSGMHFTAKASTEQGYLVWVNQLKNSLNKLDISSYQKLASPSQNHPVAYYALSDKNLYEAIINKYEKPPYFAPAGEL